MTIEQGHSSDKVPNGYRQGFITAITVLLTFSLAYLRFVVFEPESGPWTAWGVVGAVLDGLSSIILLFTLWRALQVADERVRVYTVTVRWFTIGIVVLGAGLVVHAATLLIY